jgi:hypothetical protein
MVLAQAGLIKSIAKIFANVNENIPIPFQNGPYVLSTGLYELV